MSIVVGEVKLVETCILMTTNGDRTLPCIEPVANLRVHALSAAESLWPRALQPAVPQSATTASNPLFVIFLITRSFDKYLRTR